MINSLLANQQYAKVGRDVVNYESCGLPASRYIRTKQPCLNKRPGMLHSSNCYFQFQICLSNDNRFAPFYAKSFCDPAFIQVIGLLNCRFFIRNHVLPARMLLLRTKVLFLMQVSFIEVKEFAC